MTRRLPHVVRQTLVDNDYTTLLLEGIRDQNKAVVDAVADMPTRRENAVLRKDMTDLSEDVKIVKAAVTDLRHRVADHEDRITRVETA